MKRIFNFIKYNNFFTIIIMCLVLGSGVSLAATPAVRDTIVSKTEVATSIDNSYIIAVDLNSYNFHFKINNVTEDTNNFYIDYTYTTISLVDSVWQDTVLNKSLLVAKTALGNKDLGVFVSEQLGQVIDSQLAYLKDVKKIETDKGLSHKIVSTEYSGLIGRMLSKNDEVFEGYTPVINSASSSQDQNTSSTNGTLTDTSGRSQSVPDTSVPVSKEDEIRSIVEQIIAARNASSTPSQHTTSTSTPAETPSLPVPPDTTSTTTSPVDTPPVDQTPPPSDSGTSSSTSTTTSPAPQPPVPDVSPDASSSTQ